MSWPIPRVLRSDLEYEFTLWGEVIHGTKGAIQRLGIGVGMAFPGEPGAPKREMSARDPRGFDCRIIRKEDDKLPYFASIRFPGRERDEERWEDFAPGVRKDSGAWWYDEYIGTGEALATAGLIRFDQLPGQPGMGKVAVTVSPDGTIARQGSQAVRKPGSKKISRIGKGRYKLHMLIPGDQQERRREAGMYAWSEWEARMEALPRPAPLIAFPGESRETARARRMARLRVVEGIRQTFEETTPTPPKPQYHTEGNVIRFPWTAA